VILTENAEKVVARRKLFKWEVLEKEWYTAFVGLKMIKLII
jgi:hypothetical protein